MSGFEICSGCERHVRVEDGRCPFCGAAVQTVRAEPGWGVRLAAALPLLLGVACDDAKKPEKAEPAKSDAKTKVEPEGKSDAKAEGEDEDDAKAEGDAKADGDDAKADGDDDDDAKTDADGDDDDDAKAEGGITSPEGDAKVDEDPKYIPKPKYGLPRPNATQYGTPPDRPQATKYGGPPRPAKKYGAPPMPDDDPS